jgi:dGTPase
MQAALVADLVDHTREALRRQAPADADAARLAPPLVGFSAPMRQAGTELKRFLLHALYRHAQVRDSMQRARQVVAELFAAYVQRPLEMPAEHAAQPRRERAVADYIAGMTDRFALREHQRLTGRVLFAAAA